MFTATFDFGGNFLRKLLDVLKDDVPEPVLTISQEGITLQSLDKSHVSLIHLFIDVEQSCTHYECDDSYDICVNCHAMSKILKCAPSQSLCTLIYDPDGKSNVLTFVIKQSDNVKTFDLKLLDIGDAGKIEVPEFDHACQVGLEPHMLHNVVQDLLQFSEDVVISRTGKKIIFEAVGDVVDSCEEMELKEEYSEELRLTFSLKYLNWFTKAASLCSEATLALDEDLPLLLHFEGEALDIKFFLAPKNET